MLEKLAVTRFWDIIDKIQLDPILEIRVPTIYTEEESALAGSPIPEAKDFIKLLVKELPHAERECWHIVEHFEEIWTESVQIIN